MKERPGVRRHNLPAERTSFIGRERELTEVEHALVTTRLLTLTGTGGSGKTRLALEVARELVTAYPGGVWLVELAPLSEGALILQAVAATLEVREQPGLPLAYTLAEALREQEILLVLDNCEHLVEAVAALVDTLLNSCPRLRVLATSREALRVAGEVVLPVPPLSLLDVGYSSTPEELSGYESARLFLERAIYRPTTFHHLTQENAEAVAEICRKLGGVPLAIELAAAMVGTLSVEQIATRLNDSLKLLTGGNRTAQPRQQTLRGALDWSYDLLTESERVLFGRLSVFAGGWTLEAVETIGAGSGIEEEDVLDLLSRLIEKSLVMVGAGEDGSLRYSMLEPVRQYGREKLEESGEADAIRRQHGTFFLALAEEAEQGLREARQGEWLERLEREHDNLRTALSWALESSGAEPGLRLGGALGEFWHLCGYLSEGRRWLEAVLAKSSEASTAARAKALARAGYVAWEQGDYERSVALSEESLALSRKLGDKVGVAAALYTLGWAAMFGNEIERASALVEEAITLQRETNDTVGVARSLLILGFVANSRRDHERAMMLYEESLALAREAGDGFAISLSLGVGALAALGLGDHRRTRTLCEEGLKLSWQLKTMHLTAAYLHVAASLAGSEGRAVRAARLWGAAESLREGIGTILSLFERYLYEPYVTAAREVLDEAAWEAAWAEGKAMSLEEVVGCALSTEEHVPPAFLVPQTGQTLTAREVEVLRLISSGDSNQEIVEELNLSIHTVKRHVANILRKLDVPSRTRAAARARDLGVI